jgi:hypothetical protein
MLRPTWYSHYIKNSEEVCCHPVPSSKPRGERADIFLGVDVLVDFDVVFPNRLPQEGSCEYHVRGPPGVVLEATSVTTHKVRGMLIVYVALITELDGEKLSG